MFVSLNAICIGTGSGKSLVYHVAVMEALAAHFKRAYSPHTPSHPATSTSPSTLSTSRSTSHRPSSLSLYPRSIFIFPTKALAQDQLAKTRRLLSCLQTQMHIAKLANHTQSTHPYAHTHTHTDTNSAMCKVMLEADTQAFLHHLGICINILLSNLSLDGKYVCTCVTWYIWLMLCIYTGISASLAQLCDTLDGDTVSNKRQRIGRYSSIVLTNPDMLHCSLLAYHQSYAELFSSLKYIVLDECHVYTGNFGSNVSNVIRRLHRICSFYGSKPTFICCSATIANPIKHVSSLIHIQTSQLTLIDNDTSPRPKVTHLLWNPPFVSAVNANLTKRSHTTHTNDINNDNSGTNIVREAHSPTSSTSGNSTQAPPLNQSRMSTHVECALILAAVVRAGYRALCFCRVRKVVELISLHCKRIIKNNIDYYCTDDYINSQPSHSSKPVCVSMPLCVYVCKHGIWRIGVRM